MGELPPALETEPEVIEFVYSCIGRFFAAWIWDWLGHRPAAVALEGRPKHLRHTNDKGQNSIDHIQQSQVKIYIADV